MKSEVPLHGKLYVTSCYTCFRGRNKTKKFKVLNNIDFCPPSFNFPSKQFQKFNKPASLEFSKTQFWLLQGKVNIFLGDSKTEKTPLTC